MKKDNHLQRSGLIVNDCLNFSQHFLVRLILKADSKVRQESRFDAGREDCVKRTDQFEGVLQFDHVIDLVLDSRQRLLKSTKIVKFRHELICR